MIVQVLASIVFSLAIQAASPAAQGSKPETPRALIERAAYRAEHERDLDGAIALYAEAAKLALARGEAAAAKEADLARQRLLARQGQGEIPAPQADAEIAARAAKLVAFAAVKTNYDDYKADLADIALFGAIVVPWLEELLVRPVGVEFGGYRVSSNPAFAAYALARIEAPEAVAALARGLDSKDPLVRRAVVRAADGTRHRDLLVRATRDPVEQVRAAAIGRLSASRDLDLYPLFEEHARAGDEVALEWCVNVAVERLVERLGAADFDDTFRAKALVRSIGRRALATPQAVESALRLAKATANETVRDAVHEYVAVSFEKAHESSHDVPGRAREAAFEEIAVRELMARPHEAALHWSWEVAGERTLRALPEIAAKVAATGDAKLLDALAGLVARVDSRSAPEHEKFELWLALFRSLPEPLASHAIPETRPGTTVRGHCASQLERLASSPENAPPLARTLEIFNGLAGKSRAAFLPVVWSRLETEARSSGAREFALPATVVPALGEMLASADERTIQAAANAFRSVGDPAAIEVVLDAFRIPAALQRLGSAGDLAQLHPAIFERALEARIAPLLAKPELDEADRELLGAIAWLPGERALALWGSAWSRATSERVRSKLLETLVYSIRGTAATAEVAAHWADIPAGAANLQVRAIGRFGDELFEPAIPILGEALRARSEHVRTAARDASQKFKQHREALEEFAAWTKASAEARQSIAELVALLESENRDVAIGAVRALAALKAKSALPALVKMLARDDPALKAAVQDAIARIGE